MRNTYVEKWEEWTVKEMLSSNQLIEHMKKKGIKFTITAEDDAKQFLVNNNYYMKLAAYRTNYEKQNQECKTKGQYINLEFAYLQELSTIDMHLRYLIIEMCLDIEHHIKLELLNGIEREGDNGYQLIKSFLENNDKVLKKINAHKSSEYCKRLIERYYPEFPAWVFVELISFGEVTYLCEFYRKTYGKAIMDRKFLNLVRDLRNASAHSNCLINRLGDKINGNPDKRVLDYLKKFECAGKESVKNNLKYSSIYYFIVLIYVYDNIVKSEAIKSTRYVELAELWKIRICRNKEYFEKNDRIKSQYRFIEKVIDKLGEK